jgi:hypothetical protein
LKYLTEMNKLLIYLLLILPFKSVGQDVLILRDGETFINCQILLLSDSIIQYKAWKTSDTTVYTLKSYEVLSFKMDKNSDIPDMVEWSDYSEEGMLGMYNMGETVSGYILLNDGQKSDGFIKVNDVVASQFGITFIDGNGKSTLYEPGKIAGFGYGKVEYQTVDCGYTKPLHPTYKSAGGKLFLHRIITGPALLYRIYRIEFNKSIVIQNPYPPLFNGHLDHEFVIGYPKNVYTVTFGKGPKSSLVNAFENHTVFVRAVQDSRIQKADIPEWVGKFNYWISDQVKQ